MKKKNLLNSLLFLSLIFTLSCMRIAPSLILSIRPSHPSTLYVCNCRTQDAINNAKPRNTIRVTSRIQDAINNAKPGDTILVGRGTYYENILINKSVTLIGEERDETIIDGNGNGSVVRVTSHNVKIMNFTIQNGRGPVSDIYSGILLISNVTNVTICNNIIRNNIQGVNIRESNGNLIADNLILNNSVAGINIVQNSISNSIIGNTLINNTAGIRIYSSYNKLYRNNFINNRDYPLRVFGGVGNLFDNGVEGNYWSDYKGADNGSLDPRTGNPRVAGDGVGDTELPHWGIDYNPLMEPWNMTRVYYVDSQVVEVCCNYTVASFEFNQTERQIRFYITGPPGWRGFCNVSVPQALLNPNESSSERWIVMLGSNQLTNVNIVSVNDSTLISFNYTLGSHHWENKVRLKIGVYYPPTANFQHVPTEGTVIAPVAFNDTSISPNGTIVWRRWDFGDGNVTVTDATYFTHQFEYKGIFKVTLMVKDDKNGTDSMTTSIVISNIHPVANFTFSPLQPKVGEDIYFLGNASRDDDGHIIRWLWNFGDGASSSDMNALYAYQHSGTYNVTLTVWDDDNVSNSTTKTVIVGKGTTCIEIDAPEVVRVRQNFTVTAMLKDCANRPISGEYIVFYCDEEKLGNATTDYNGVAILFVRLSIVGTYQIKAHYTGSADYFGSNATVNVRFDPLNTTLFVDVPQNATQNDAITLYGILMDEDGIAVSSATIRFYLYNGSSWEEIGCALTNQSGIACLNYTLQHTGIFKLKGVFDGERIYAASESNEATFMVTAKESDYTFHIVLVVTAAIAICATIVLKRRRR